MADIEVTVTRSAGADGAVIVFIDTAFEPDGSDNGPGLRIILNDSDTYTGKPHQYDGEDHEAPALTFHCDLEALDYIEDEGEEGTPVSHI